MYRCTVYHGTAAICISIELYELGCVHWLFENKYIKSYQRLCLQCCVMVDR